MPLRSALLLLLAPVPLLVGTGCAAGVWGRRVVPCDEVDRIDVSNGYVAVGDVAEAARDDCYVVLRNLWGLEGFDGGLIEGDGLEVYTNDRRLELVLEDTQVDLAFGARRIEGDVSFLRWVPRTERLVLTADDDVVIEGGYGEVVLDGDGDVVFDGRFDRVMATGLGSLELSTTQRFDEMTVSADEIDLVLPLQATYDFAVGEADIDPRFVDSSGALGSTRVDLTGGSVSVVGVNPGPAMAETFAPICDGPFLGMVAWWPFAPRMMVDIVETAAGADAAYESHRLFWWGSRFENWVEANATYSSNPKRPQSGYRCVGGSLAEWDRVTWALRTYQRADDGSLTLDRCVAFGHDPAGLLDGLYDDRGQGYASADLSWSHCEVGRW